MNGQNTIQIAPAVARLTQVYARAHQLSFRNRVARLIAAEAIQALDPSLELCLDEGSSLSEIDAVARILAVNDIVVNGQHLDIAVVDSHSRGIALPEVLVLSNYISNGSLIVQMSDTASGAVVGYIGAGKWHESVQSSRDSNGLIEYRFESEAGFDLESCLTGVLHNHQKAVQMQLSSKSDVQAADYMHFLRDPSSLPLEKQTRVINNLLVDSAVRENVSALSEFQVDGLHAVLQQASIWEMRVNNLAQRLQINHPEWQTAQLAELIRKVGNKCGGQPQSPSFKLEIARSLLQNKMAAGLSMQTSEVADALLTQLFAGKKAIDSVRQYVKNQIAVDIAAQIQETRKNLIDFSQATGDEIAFALRKLSLQPAYATHSQSETSPVDDINEALQLYTIVKIGDELDYILMDC